MPLKIKGKKKHNQSNKVAYLVLVIIISNKKGKNLRTVIAMETANMNLWAEWQNCCRFTLEMFLICSSKHVLSPQKESVDCILVDCNNHYFQNSWLRLALSSVLLISRLVIHSSMFNLHRLYISTTLCTVYQFISNL